MYFKWGEKENDIKKIEKKKKRRRRSEATTMTELMIFTLCCQQLLSCNMCIFPFPSSPSPSQMCVPVGQNLLFLPLIVHLSVASLVLNTVAVGGLGWGGGDGGAN